jgi:hypothetical protein
MRSKNDTVVRSLGVRTLVAAGGFVLGLLLIEAALRVSNVWIGRHSDMMFTIIEHDATLGWKMKTGVHGAIDLVDVEGVPVRSNSLGFWDREFEVAKSPERRRLAFLGDSFTWGMGVREQERFSNRLAADNPGWESLNFGMPGYGTDQALLVWERLAARYQPDLVILTIYQNDFVDNLHLVRYGRRKPYFELKANGDLELKEAPVGRADFWSDGIYNQIAPPYALLSGNSIEKRSRIAHWLAKNSDLVRISYTMYRLRERRDSVGAGQAGEASATQASLHGHASVQRESTLTPIRQLEVNLMDALVERLAHEVHETGARLAIVLAGSPIAEFEAVKERFERAGIPSLDATTPVLAKLLPEGTNAYYPYSQHWTAAAHQAVAGMLSRWMRDQGLISDQ